MKTLWPESEDAGFTQPRAYSFAQSCTRSSPWAREEDSSGNEMSLCSVRGNERGRNAIQQRVPKGVNFMGSAFVASPRAFAPSSSAHFDAGNSEQLPLEMHTSVQTRTRGFRARDTMRHRKW